jgi:DNA-binding MarR family transcriptional regulator
MQENASPPERAQPAGLPIGATEGTVGLEPTEQDLRLFARVVLHVARQPHAEPTETAPVSLTQAGIAEALRTSQANVSYALRRLVGGGVLKEDRGHVQGLPKRLKVYRLTAEGERLALHIQQTMGSR